MKYISVKALLESHLINYFKQVADMVKGNPQGEFWQWKVDHAHEVQMTPTAEIRKQYPDINRYLSHTHVDVNLKECYGNSGKLALYCDNVEYVEGEISYMGVPIEHAWNKIDGKYFDITKDTLFANEKAYDEYVAVIELSMEQFAKYMYKYKHWGGWIYEEFMRQTGKDQKKAIPRKRQKAVSESADMLKFGKEIHLASDKDARSFVADINENGQIKVAIGPPGFPHAEAGLFGMYPGRMFIDAKIISFWRHPEKYLLVKILHALENSSVLKSQGIKFLGNRDWRIEIFGDINKDWYDATDIPYEYRRDLKNAKFPILDDYLESAIQSEDAPEEEYAEHQKSPLLRKSKEVTQGFGSKHPKAESRFKEKMQVPFESETEDYYPALNENPNSINIYKIFPEDDEPESPKNVVGWHEQRGAWTFGWTLNEDEFKCEDGWRTHFDLFGVSSKYMISGRGKDSGRLFPDYKVITFWDFPKDHAELIDVIKRIENITGYEILDDPKWKVEIPSRESYELSPKKKEWGDWDPKPSDTEYVSIDDYVNPGVRPKEEMEQEHVKSPLLKKSKDVPYGFGSKNPKAEARFKEKMEAPFENKEEDFYPALVEGDKMDAYYERKFGVKREEHEIPIFKKDVVATVKDDRLKEIPIFKNPKNLNDYDDEVRAIADEDGNLYVAFQDRLFNHGMMGNALMDAGEIKTKKYNDLARTHSSASGVYADQKHFLLLQRLYNTNTFIASDVFDWVGGETERMIQRLRSKNSQFNYKLPEYEEDYDELDDDDAIVYESIVNKLFEDPDYVKDPRGEETKDENGNVVNWDVIDWNEYGTHAFGYLNGKFAIGRPGRMHRDIMVPGVGAGNERKSFRFPGRIWTEQKVISFWNYPNKQQFEKFAADLKKATGIDIMNDPNYKVEIIKNPHPHPKKHAAGEWTPYWSGKNPDKWVAGPLVPSVVDFVHPKEYGGSLDQPDQDKQHVISPLLKKSKDVPQGYGSKHPKAPEKFKQKMNAPFESYYPRLNESPDTVMLDNGRELFFNAVPGHSYSFGYYKGEFLLGNEGSTHGHLGDHINTSFDRYDFDLPGRIWIEEQLISFWVYPTEQEFKKFAEDIKKAFATQENIRLDIMSEGWKVEVKKRFNGEEIVRGGAENLNHEIYGGAWWNEKEEDFKFYTDLVPTKEYAGSEALSDEEKNVQHVISPLLKAGKEVPQGFGSKHPKAEEIAKKKREQPFESYYPRLNESPDSIFVDQHYYSVVDVMVGAAGKSHGQANVQYNPRGYMLFYQNYHGRLYTTPKVITFWRFPKKEEMVDIIHMLEEKIGKKIFGNDWRIEITEEYKDDDGDIDYRVSFLSIDFYLRHNMKATDFSDEEYQEHLKSPLLKKKKDVPAGFGSKHPKAEELAKQKRDQPFESLKEFAMPTSELRSKLWYHGTREELAYKILEDKALKIDPTPRKAYMAPQKNRIYLTNNLEDGIGYAFFRNGSHLSYPNAPNDGYAYLVVVNGNDLKDVNPDEDIIADLYYSSLPEFSWIKPLCKRVDPKLSHKYDTIGDYRFGTALGKKVVEWLTDEQKIQLINHGCKLAGSGDLPIYQLWKIPLNKQKELKENPSNYKKFS